MRAKKEFTPEEMAVYMKDRFRAVFGTQEQAAEYFQVSQSTISLLENGKIQPNLDILIWLGYEQETVYKRVS